MKSEQQEGFSTAVARMLYTTVNEKHVGCHLPVATCLTRLSGYSSPLAALRIFGALFLSLLHDCPSRVAARKATTHARLMLRQ